MTATHRHDTFCNTMNTPAHAIINLLLFPKQKREKHALIIIAGALLPDAPMFTFYIWAKFSGLSESNIWRQGYFDTHWQALFDTFHSFPLLGLAWFIVWRTGMNRLSIFFASMFMHSCFDFPIHHHDAHHHFFPLSDWRFLSPLSYWNPAYHGQIVGLIELIVVIAGGAWLLRTSESKHLKLGAAFILFAYLIYWGFISLLWI